MKRQILVIDAGVSQRQKVTRTLRPGGAARTAAKGLYQAVLLSLLGLLLVFLVSAVTPIATSAPPTGAQLSASVRFVAFGDYGDNSAAEAAVADLVNSLSPDFIITVGDNSYDATPIDDNIGQYYHSYIGDYNGLYLPGAATNRFFPALGNHDYSDGGGLAAYLAYFTLPGAGISGSYTSGNERYYDFVRGPVHFFAINSNAAEPDGQTSTSPQAQWLQAQLAASTAPWKIVYMHHPPYSSASTHGSQTVMQWPYEDWGATAVLAGHDHTYERLLRDDNDDGVDLVYFVSGLGGKSRYTFPSDGFVPGSQMRYRDDYGTLLIEACAERITFRFYSISDGLVDTYTLGASSCAAEGVVQGKVLNNRGAGVKGATVSVRDSLTNTVSGNGGSYSLQTGAGTFSLAAAAAAGWHSLEPITRTISLTESTPLTFTLSPPDNFIQNGGFEGNLNGWGSNLSEPIFITEHHRSGNYSLLISQSASLTQTKIVTGMYRPVLSFWYKVEAGHEDNSLRVRIFGHDNLVTTAPLSFSYSTGRWRHITLSLVLSTTPFYSTASFFPALNREVYSGPLGVQYEVNQVALTPTLFYLDEVTFGQSWREPDQVYLPLLVKSTL